MIRIVGIQRSEDPNQEFVVLQNQGNMRVNLRGHALLSESSIGDPDGHPEIHVITEDMDIPAGHHCVVRTGIGACRWCHKHEGFHIYHAFLGRTSPVWHRFPGAVHILAPTHTYSGRTGESLLV